jgi:hypothetical protein
MKDLTKLLKDADPLGPQTGEEELSAADAQTIRRAMLAAIREPVGPFRLWHRPFALATIVALVVGLGGVAGHRILTPTAPPPVAASADATEGGSSVGNDRRQLQFATPGGTRSIWVFNQNLRLQESMP